MTKFYWAAVFCICASICGWMALVIAPGAASIAKILFFGFFVATVVAFLRGLFRPEP